MKGKEGKNYPRWTWLIDKVRKEERKAERKAEQEGIMKFKKILTVLISVSMMATMLTGCSKASNDTKATTDEAANTVTEAVAEETPTEAVAEEVSTEKVEIHYAYWQDVLGTYLEQAKADFEAQNANVTIVLEPTSWAEYWTKLETAATGGSVADVFQMNGPNISKYALGGAILPIDDYIANSDVDLANYPQAMNSLYNVEGVQYGIPVDYDTIGLWYNKELFDAAGLAYPNENWTWDDLVSAAAKLTNKDTGVYGISAGFADQGGFYNTVFASGGYILNDDKTACGFDQPATIAGIQCWVDLMKAGYSPSEASVEENPDYTQFMSGKIGMLFAGDWFAATFAGPDSDFTNKCDVALLPTINGKRASVIHGKANCVSASSANPDQAWAWVNYLAGAQANQYLGESGAAIPAYTEYSSLFFDKYPQYNMGIFSQEATECAYAYPASKTSAEWGNIIWTELVPAYTLEVSVEDACASITTQMNELLATEAE